MNKIIKLIKKKDKKNYKKVKKVKESAGRQRPASSKNVY